MHLQLVVNNDTAKTPLEPNLPPPAWDGSDAERRAASELIRAIEVRPSLTVAEALKEYAEARLVADFAASDEGYAITEDEVFKLQQEAIELDFEASLVGLNFGWIRPLHGAPAITQCVVLWPRRLLNKEPRLKPYKHVLHMLDV